MPRVSVLLPVHQAEHTLASAVESVLAQTFEDFELIAVDDGSTDGSRRILERFAGEDNRVRVFSRENRGLVTTLNEASGTARGEYLARMDADDLCEPQRFERQVAHLDAHPGCVAVGSRVLLIDAEGSPIRTFAEATTHDEIDGAHLAGQGGAICHPAVMLRAEALKRVGGYDPAMKHAEDIDLFLRLAEVGSLANLPDVLLRYRMLADSVGHRHRDVQHATTVAAVARAHERRGLGAPPPLPEKAPVPVAELHRKWAWWALEAGHRATARKHAARALARAPLATASWKLALVALRGG